MKQEGLLFFTDLWLTLGGLIIFFSFFIVMLIRVRTMRPEYFEHMSNQPLQEESES